MKQVLSSTMAVGKKYIITRHHVYVHRSLARSLACLMPSCTLFGEHNDKFARKKTDEAECTCFTFGRPR